MSHRIIAGRNPVFEHLKKAESGEGLELHVSETAHGRIIEEIYDEAARKGVPIRIEKKEYFDRFASVAHQGVVLLAAAPDPHPVFRSADSLVEEAVRRRGLIVVLDHVNDPRNAGAIIRTAEALGCVGAVLPKDRSVSLGVAAEKASAGATAHLPIARITNIASFLTQAKHGGLWIIGTSERADRGLDRLAEYLPAALVIGGEAHGMRRLTAEKCDLIVRIPTRGTLTSLNAAVAAGIVIYELTKEH